MKNIEDYGFDRSELIIATAVNSYLKNLTPEARRKALAGIVRQEGVETVVNGSALATLIESAKAAAMIGSQDWEDGDDLFAKRTLEYIRDQLPALDGKEYMKNPPKEFLRFIEDWAKQ